VNNTDATMNEGNLMSQGNAINVVFVVFDDVTQLDFTGPAQCLARMPVLHGGTDKA